MIKNNNNNYNNNNYNKTNNSATTSTQIQQVDNTVNQKQQQPQIQLNNPKLILNLNKTSTNQENYKSRKRNQIIKGVAIFNNTLIDYLVDSGASCTLINEDVFNKIKKEAPETVLEQYKGNELYSASNKIEIIGTVKL